MKLTREEILAGIQNTENFLKDNHAWDWNGQLLFTNLRSRIESVPLEQKEQDEPTTEEIRRWAVRELERSELHLTREFGAVKRLIEIDIRILNAVILRMAPAPVSKCCGAAVKTEFGNRYNRTDTITHWNVCAFCGHPCDVEEKPCN